MFSKINSNVIGIAGVAAFVSGLGYLYHVYSQEENESCINTSIAFNSLNDSKMLPPTEKQLSKDKAIKLMAIIQNLSEEFVETKLPNFEEKRRKLINETKEYDKFCSQILKAKNEAQNQVIKNVEEKYGYSYKAIADEIEKIDSIELEERLSRYNSKLLYQSKYEEDLIRNAFIFYGNKCLEQIKNCEAILKDASSNSRNKEFFHDYYMIQKFKAEDELFLKFTISEVSLKYFLFKYKLNTSDKEISDLLNQIASKEEKFGLLDESENK